MYVKDAVMFFPASSAKKDGTWVLRRNLQETVGGRQQLDCSQLIPAIALGLPIASVLTISSI